MNKGSYKQKIKLEIAKKWQKKPTYKRLLELSDEYGVSDTTIYRYLWELKVKPHTTQAPRSAKKQRKLALDKMKTNK